MPVEECTVDGQPGRRWGTEGTCYPCDGDDCADAHAKAEAQGQAIGEHADDPDESPEGDLTFTAILALEGVVTTDDRYIDRNGTTWPELPIPLRVTLTDHGSHDGAMAAGSITKVWREPREDGAILLMGSGTFDDSEVGRDTARMAASGTKTGISIDPSGATITIMALTADGEPAQLSGPEDIGEFLNSGGRVVERALKLRMRAATVLDIPAFEGARFTHVDAPSEAGNITAAATADNGVLAFGVSGNHADELAIEGGSDPADMHVTLMVVPSGFDPESTPLGPDLPITASTWGTATFNRDDPTRPASLVYLVESDELSAARETIFEALGRPEQTFPVWIPHVTVAADHPSATSDDLAFNGGIEFDRLLWLNDGQATDITSVVTRAEPSDPDDDAEPPSPDDISDEVSLAAAGVPPHSTPIAPNDRDWDGNSAEKALPTGEEPSFYRKFYTYQDDDTDGTAKDHWHYIHHFVEGSGSDAAVGDASLEACVAIVQLLNGARGVNLKVSGTDRQTVYDHVAKHMADAGYDDIPELKPEAEVQAAMSDRPDTITASAVDIPQLPAEHFDPIDFDEPTPLTITEDGHVYGHVANSDVCHVGYPDCVPMPDDHSNMSYFHTGVVRLDDGTDLATGRITAKGGHADPDASWQAAVAHYDDMSTTWADVVAWQDEFGIAVTGHVRPGVSPDFIHAIRGSTPSGDWRQIGSDAEIINVHMVNSPGFPVYRMDGDRVRSAVVASAAPARTEPASSTQPDPDDIARRVVSIMRTEQEVDKISDSLADDRAHQVKRLASTIDR